MARLDRKFDAHGETLTDFTPVPAGEYLARIVKSERKDTNARDGWLINFEWKIMGGEFNDRAIFDNCNLGNKSEKAVAVANKQLTTMCKAIGRSSIEDTEELHDKPMIIVVGIRPAKGDYGPKNTIKNYKPADGSNFSNAGSSHVPSNEPAKEEEKKPAKAPWDD